MKIIIRQSFGLKLSLSIITVVVFIFLAVLIYNYQISKKLILENTTENVKNLQNAVLREIDGTLLPVKKTSEDLKVFLTHSDLNKSEIKNILLDIVKNNEEIFGCCIAFEPYMFEKDRYFFEPYAYKPGGVLTYWDDEEPDEEYNYFKWDWYTIPKKLGRGVWSEPYFDEGSGNVWMVTYSEPVYKEINGQKQLLAIIATDLELDWLEELIGKIKIYSSGLTFMLSTKGMFIVHPNKEFFKRTETFMEFAKKYNDPESIKIAEEMISGKTGWAKCFSPTLKDTAIIVYQPLSTTGWSMAIVIPLKELYSKLNTTTFELFLIGIIGYVITLIMILIFSSRATLPLRKLAQATTKIGRGDFNVEIPKVKTSDEIGVLSNSFIKMQTNLVKFVQNLQETTAAKEKIERDLAIGKEIQQSLIPHNFPKNKEFDIYAKLIPAREVSGDLYDFFFIDNDHLCFAIGDVSGKGVPAALFMAVTKTLLRAKIGIGLDPAQAISSMNAELCKENEAVMFVTFFLSVLNIKTGELKYCSAGHNPPLVKTGGVFKYLYSNEFYPPLGALAENNDYSNSLMKMNNGDIIFLYTDGVTEAMSKDSVEFSNERFLELANNNKDKSLEVLTSIILDNIREHAEGTEPSDDITMLIIRYNGQ